MGAAIAAIVDRRVEASGPEAERFHQAIGRRGRPARLSMFHLMSWLATPEIRAAIAAQCGPGQVPVHVRQRCAAPQPLHPSTVYRLDAELSERCERNVKVLILSYRLRRRGGEVAAEGEVEMIVVDRVQLIGQGL